MIDRLEFFLALARTRHFGRAADLCGVTQPTLSAAIRHLEGELGVLLVHRGSRFREFTTEGEQVLEWARRIVADAHAMRDEMRAARHGLSGRIRLAAIPTALSTVADLTTPFREMHPGVSFSVLSRTSVEVISMLGSFEVDVGIAYLDNELLGNVLTVPLFAERYMLITTVGAPLSKRDHVTWAEVGKLPLCLLTHDSENRGIIDRYLMGTRPVLESDSVLALLAHVMTGEWSSIMPLELTSNLRIADSISAIPIGEPGTSRIVGLVAAKRDPHTPLVTALLALARSRRVTDEVRRRDHGYAGNAMDAHRQRCLSKNRVTSAA